MQVFENKIENVIRFLNYYFLTDGIKFELVNKLEKTKTPITNSINPPIPLNQGLVKINFHDYFEDIEGYALIKNKNNFITKFEDITFVGELYKYDEENGLQKVDDFSSLEIDNYINGNEIEYLIIPLVESHLEDDFLSGMKFTGDDVTEVLEKLDRELSWISIIVPKDYQGCLSANVIGERDSIFDKLSFDELVELGHSMACKTKSTIGNITLFEGQKNNLYLPFDKSDRDSYFSYRNEKRKELFIRNVLIKDFRFKTPISASIFEISTIVMNINSRKIIPDISRNNVDSKEQDLINYMIGKTIHMGVVNVLSLNLEEKLALEKFISEFYDEKTEFEK